MRIEREKVALRTKAEPKNKNVKLKNNRRIELWYL